MELSFIIPIHHGASTLKHTVREIDRTADRLSGGSYEVLLVPNPYRTPQKDPLQAETQSLCEELARATSRIRVVRSAFRTGKGSSLREGVRHARGRWILTTDADLPYDLTFFDHALPLLQDGADFVYGDRRHPETLFDLPMSVLDFTASRLTWGNRFSRFANFCLGLGSVDTQAGIKAYRGEIAKKIFGRIRCDGFHFDLEVFVMAQELKAKCVGLPVTFRQNTDQSTLNPGSEILRSLRWIYEIRAGKLRGDYR